MATPFYFDHCTAHLLQKSFIKRQLNQFSLACQECIQNEEEDSMQIEFLRLDGKTVHMFIRWTRDLLETLDRRCWEIARTRNISLLVSLPFCRSAQMQPGNKQEMQNRILEQAEKQVRIYEQNLYFVQNVPTFKDLHNPLFLQELHNIVFSTAQTDLASLSINIETSLARHFHQQIQGFGLNRQMIDSLNQIKKKLIEDSQLTIMRITSDPDGQLKYQSHFSQCRQNQFSNLNTGNQLKSLKKQSHAQKKNIHQNSLNIENVLVFQNQKLELLEQIKSLQKAQGILETKNKQLEKQIQEKNDLCILKQKQILMLKDSTQIKIGTFIQETGSFLSNDNTSLSFQSSQIVEDLEKKMSELLFAMEATNSQKAQLLETNRKLQIILEEYRQKQSERQQQILFLEQKNYEKELQVNKAMDRLREQEQQLKISTKVLDKSLQEKLEDKTRILAQISNINMNLEQRVSILSQKFGNYEESCNKIFKMLRAELRNKEKAIESLLKLNGQGYGDLISPIKHNQ